MQSDFNIIDIHHQQPVIINEEKFNDYINREKEITCFLKSYNVPDLKFHRVSKDINKPINNTKELIEEAK